MPAPPMTLDVYSGPFTDDLDRVAERLNVAALAAREDAQASQPGRAIGTPDSRTDVAALDGYR